MTSEQKSQRYQRCIQQLQSLLKTTPDPISRMATISSLLYHKMKHFFWIGFYRLIDGQCIVAPYQGTLGCQKLHKDKGVCWACINHARAILVPDVNRFPGHIACDSRSKSEIVVPVLDEKGNVTAVLEADSDKLNTFDEMDRQHLETIAGLIFQLPAADESIPV